MKNKTLIILISITTVLVVGLALFVGISLSISPDILETSSDINSTNNTSTLTTSSKENNKADDRDDIVTDKIFINHTSSNNNNQSKKGSSNNKSTSSKSIVSSNSEKQESKTSSTNSQTTHSPSFIASFTTNSSSNDDKGKQLFIQLYNKYYSSYISDISVQITSHKKDLQAWKDKAANNYSSYQKQLHALPEKYASMGLLNSGAYKRAVEDLELNYKRTAEEYSKKINSIEEKIKQLEKMQNNPDVNSILSTLAKENNMTYAQALEKYNKYIA